MERELGLVSSLPICTEGSTTQLSGDSPRNGMRVGEGRVRPNYGGWKGTQGPSTNPKQF